MPKVKVARKSTSIDMTAMCDVAFLLLSFFILTTKFKPSEALAVVTPNSVSAKAAPENDVVLITIDKEGRVYLSVSDKNTSEKRAIIDAINTSKSLNLTAAQKAAFARANSYVGVPFSQLGGLLSTPPDDIKKIKMAGIPVDHSFYLGICLLPNRRDTGIDRFFYCNCSFIPDISGSSGIAHVGCASFLPEQGKLFMETRIGEFVQAQ